MYAQQIDEAYNQKIREYTTDKKFLPASVLNLIQDPKIPSPLKHFGQIIGAPGVMHRTEEIYNYYKQLAQSSPYLQMKQVGTTEKGRPINLIIIGTEEALREVEKNKQQLSLLADPRKAALLDVEQIISTTKPVFYLNAGLHSTEMGSPEMLMELAYRLVTGNSADIRNIRDKLL
ncbi:MAG: hypothetical protein LH478_16135 [Chitinophagaceae bacterium]|nr:hypothetical protein [Chitinophagaceae bacterium]